jgi:hypothetical protein
MPHPSGGRRRSFGEGGLHRRRNRVRPTGLPQAWPDGQRHGLGPLRLFGPDFSAQSLHLLALDLADRIARLTLRPPLGRTFTRGPGCCRSRDGGASQGEPLRSAQRNADADGRRPRVLRARGRLLDEILYRPRWEWRPRHQRHRRSERTSRAHSSSRMRCTAANTHSGDRLPPKVFAI